MPGSVTNGAAYSHYCVPPVYSVNSVNSEYSGVFSLIFLPKQTLRELKLDKHTHNRRGLYGPNI